MVARKASGEKEKARRQKILETVHQVLYCDKEWKEAEIYARRFSEILRRAGLPPDFPVPREETVAEYSKRVVRLLSGKAPLDRSLAFFRILATLVARNCSEEELIDLLGSQNTADGIRQNLAFLLEGGFLETIEGKFQIKAKFRKMIGKGE